MLCAPLINHSSIMNFYDISILQLDRALNQLDHILDVGAAHAAEKKIEESVLLNMRLFPDMLPMSRQVMIACDMSKGCAARLAGVDIPKHEDNQTSFAELKARIAKVRAFITSFKPEQINGAESRELTLKLRGEDKVVKGQPYVQSFVLPNVYFHCSTAYALLRHAGVPLGKADFIGAF